MKGDTVRVNFHCHSQCSDGSLSPERLAEALAADGVSAAALTDHHTVQGLAAFSAVLARHQIVCATGIELAASDDGVEVHLLAYGFDPDHLRLAELLERYPATRTDPAPSVAAELVRNGATPRPDLPLPTTRDVIEGVRAAGGTCFLAHPFYGVPSPAELETRVARLSRQGLTGLEVYYAPYSIEEQSALETLADRYGLLASAGTDFHQLAHAELGQLGIDMPRERWKAFRQVVLRTSASPPPPTLKYQATGSKSRVFWQFALPSATALLLFLVAIYAIIIPSFEASLLDRKREMIRELSNAAHSILVGYHRDQEAGRITEAQAQQMAVERIRQLRYGKDDKDYFWIQDLEPRMVMHPYRPDLEGQDVGDFRDPSGVRIFSKFAALVRAGQDGYVQYVWQWKDDPAHLAAKESYIRGFEPWGWLIGTGIYVEDVKAEITQIERNLTGTALAITVVVALLLLGIVRRSAVLEGERAEAQRKVVESLERYRSLVEATNDGTLLVTDQGLRYVNRGILELTGHDESDLSWLGLQDLIPRSAENRHAWARLDALLAADPNEQSFEAQLRAEDGSAVDCVVTPSRMTVGGEPSLILLVKPLVPPPVAPTAWQDADSILEHLPVGVVRAQFTPRGTVVQANSRARAWLQGATKLAEWFGDPGSWEQFLADLASFGQAQARVGLPTQLSLEVTARLQGSDHEAGRLIDAVLADARTPEVPADHHVYDRWSQPVGPLARPVPLARSSETLAAALAQMRETGSPELLVVDDEGHALGLVLAGDVALAHPRPDPAVPLREVMLAPVPIVSYRALRSEAVAQLARRPTQPLVVQGPQGRPAGLLRATDLLGSDLWEQEALISDLRQAETSAEVVALSRRRAQVAKHLLDEGRAPEVSGFLTRVHDAATGALLRQLGAGPEVAWVALGSHGRGEATLSSDQDSMLIGADSGFVRATCAALHEAGFHRCPVQAMADNPRWQMPLERWKAQFSEWVRLPEPQPLLEFSIFFDLRLVAGSQAMVDELRSHIHSEVARHPGFLAHLARQVAHSKLASRPSARHLPGLPPFDHPAQFDVKEPLAVLVGFARLYALAHQVPSLHTLDRLAALAELGVVGPGTLDDCKFAYEALVGARLRRQVEQGDEPDNLVSLARLGRVERLMLHEALGQLAVLQKRLAQDFLGGISA